MTLRPGPLSALSGSQRPSILWLCLVWVLPTSWRNQWAGQQGASGQRGWAAGCKLGVEHAILHAGARRDSDRGSADGCACYPLVRHVDDPSSVHAQNNLPERTKRASEEVTTLGTRRVSVSPNPSATVPERHLCAQVPHRGTISLNFQYPPALSPRPAGSPIQTRQKEAMFDPRHPFR